MSAPLQAGALDTELRYTKSTRPFGTRLRTQSILILMSVPFLAHLILFRFGPLFGWVMAFQNYRPGKPLFDQTWVGLEQFRLIFQDPFPPEGASPPASPTSSGTPDSSPERARSPSPDATTPLPRPG